MSCIDAVGTTEVESQRTITILAIKKFSVFPIYGVEPVEMDDTSGIQLEIVTVRVTADSDINIGTSITYHCTVDGVLVITARRHSVARVGPCDGGRQPRTAWSTGWPACCSNTCRF